MAELEEYQQIIFPGGVGMNRVVDATMLNRAERCAYLLNLDTHITGEWRSRMPVRKESITLVAGSFDSAPLAMFHFRKADGSDEFTVMLLADGRLMIKDADDSNYTASASFLTEYATTGNLPGGVFYRDKLLVYNGYDVLQFITDKSTFGDAGVEAPDAYPYTIVNGTYHPLKNSLNYDPYSEDDGGILGGLGGGMIQYKHLFEYEDGLLYGNAGQGGSFPHFWSDDFSAEDQGYGNPLILFPWFNRYQISSVQGKYYPEGSVNDLVTARILIYRHKHYANEQFTAWEKSNNRNIGDMTVSSDSLWADTKKRTGIPVDIDNDEPPKFLHAAVVGGSKGAIAWANRQGQRPIPVPAAKATPWAASNYRNLIEIQNNDDETFTRPQVRILIVAADLKSSGATSRDIITDYKDIVFSDADGRTVWDCYEDPFKPYQDFGDTDTEFNITDEGNDTFRYTWDGVDGEDPDFVTNGLVVGDELSVNIANANANNNGVFVVTDCDEGWFEVTNASGVAEANKSIGAGWVAINHRAFIVTPVELVAGAVALGYIYYRDDATGNSFYGSVYHAVYPWLPKSNMLFLSHVREYYFPPNTLNTGDNEAFRNLIHLDSEGWWAAVDSANDDFGGSTKKPSWTNVAGLATQRKPYGLDSANISSYVRGALFNDGLLGSEYQYSRLCWDKDNVADFIGRQLSNFTMEIWFACTTDADLAAGDYTIMGYGCDGDGADVKYDNSFVVGLRSAGAGGNQSIFVHINNSADEILLDITGKQGAAADEVIGSGTQRWNYLAVSFSSGQQLNILLAQVFDTDPINNWTGGIEWISATELDGGGDIQDTAYELVDEATYTSSFFVGALPSNHTLDCMHPALKMTVDHICITERTMTPREMMDRARDYSYHGASAISDEHSRTTAGTTPTAAHAISQPNLSVDVDDEPESVIASEVDETEIGWTKIDGEVFPSDYVANLPEPVNGVIEWEDDAVYYCQHSIHRLVTSRRPEEWQILRNIAQEAPGEGLIAPKCLFKTDSAMVFMSQSGLKAYGGGVKETPIDLSADMWQYWHDTYGYDAIKEAVGFYYPKLQKIYVCFPTTGGGNIKRTYVLDWLKLKRGEGTHWTQYGHDGTEDFGGLVWLLKKVGDEDQEVFFNHGNATNPMIMKFGEGAGVNKYNDLDEDDNNVGIDYEVHTAQAEADEFEVRAVDIKSKQITYGGSECNNSIHDIEVHLEGSTHQTMSNRALKKAYSIKPQAKLTDSVQIRVKEGKDQGDTQTRIRKIAAQIEPVSR